MATARRPPISAAQRASERASVGSAIADSIVFALLLVATLVSSSLALLTEMLRSCGMLAVEYLSVHLLLAVHRERFAALHYGIGKVEQLCNLLCCSALVVGGLFIVEKLVNLLLQGGAPVAPAGLALAAVAAGASALVNGLSLRAMTWAYRMDSSAIFLSQINGRRAKFYASLAAFAAITGSALAKDPALGAALDGLGAIIGAFFMISIGGRLGLRCVFGVLDLQVLPDVAAKAKLALRAADAEAAGPVGLRTRRSGRCSQNEVTLDPRQHADLDALRSRAARIQAALVEAFGDAADIAVVVRPGAELAR